MAHTTAIVLDASEVEAVLKARPAINRAFCFCPSAKHTLAQHAVNVDSAATHYGALSHAKTAVWMERTLPALAQHYQNHYSLSEGEAKIFEVFLFHLCADLHYIFSATQHLSKTDAAFAWLEDSTMHTGDYAAMLHGVASAAAKRLYAYGRPHISHLHYAVAQGCNHLLIRKLRAQKRRAILDYGDRLSSHISKPLLALDKSCSLIIPKPAKNLFHTLELFARSWLNLTRGGAHAQKLSLVRTASPAAYRKLYPAPPSPTMNPSLLTPAVHNAVVTYMPFLRAEYGMGATFMEQLQPSASLSDYAIYPYIYAGIEASKRLNIPHVMINHGSHTAQHTPLAKLAAHRYARQERMLNRNTAYFLPKSPLTAAIAQEIDAAPDAKQVAAGIFKTTRHVDDGGAFMLLYAGNFSAMHNAYNSHIPLCKETAEEQLLAIYELIEECANVQGIELVIKLKNKKHDVYADLVRRFIEERDYGSFARVDTSPDFAGLLARANMVVSNLSITIEEALFSHIPVMIHTLRKQYFHIAPDYAAKPEELGPAYLVRKRGDIRHILTFVMANRHKLHDPALYARTSWQKNELTDAAEFAKELLANTKGDRP